MRRSRTSLACLVLAMAACSVTNTEAQDLCTVTHGNSKFVIHASDYLTFDGAKAACASDGGRLAEIYDAKTDAALRSQMKHNEWFFIGAKNPTGKEVVWDSGPKAIFTNWYSQEVVSATQDCIAIHKFGWIDEPCMSRDRYVCEFPTDTYTVSFGDSDYVFHLKDYLTYENAKKACAEAGAKLAEIHDKATDDFLRCNMKAFEWFLLGATNPVGKEIVWDSGSNSAFANWSPDEPGTVNEKCLAIQNNGLIDEPCSRPDRYICQSPSKGVRTVTYGNNKYVFHLGDRLTYDNAKKACEAAGSRLAEIYDAKTDAFLRSYMKAFEWFLLGATNPVGKEIVWDSGSNSAFANWSPDEPGTVNEKCLAIQNNGLIDEPCSRPDRYICQSPSKECRNK